MWSEVIYLFQEYMGTGLIVIWFLISLIYLWVHEKRKHIRLLFVHMPIVLLLLYFNPLSAAVILRMIGDEIYYRMMWLMPITAVNAYTCVCVHEQILGRLSEKKGTKKRILKELTSLMTAACLAGIIAISGSYIYSNPFFHKAENPYHVPDSVVHICDAINVPGREVMAVFPLELVQYVRQYSPVTCMPYGREALVERWNYDYPLCDAMEAEIIDMARLAPLVREASCHYVILPADKERVGVPEDYGWIWFDEIDGYVIYRDPARELTVPRL